MVGPIEYPDSHFRYDYMYASIEDDVCEDWDSIGGALQPRSIVVHGTYNVKDSIPEYVVSCSHRSHGRTHTHTYTHTQAHIHILNYYMGLVMDIHHNLKTHT